MNFPENLKYTATHEWVKKVSEDGKEAVLIGITAYAQKQLSEIVFVELPEMDQRVNKGESLAVLESVKAVSDVFSPLTGSVRGINETLLDQPELLNGDPYGEGWIALLSCEDVSEYSDLLSVSEYLSFVQEEEQKKGGEV